VVAAGILNGLKVVDKDIGKVRLVCAGAGAAALACLNLLCKIGMKRENITLPISRASSTKSAARVLMDPYKEPYAQKTDARTLDDVMKGADIFLGLSAGGIVSKDMVASMADKPLIFAMANPDPEITPEDVQSVRSDAIIATGRSDYPNQINNVLCFPFIFRGALDVQASTINDAMKIAAAEAIAELARAEVPDQVAAAFHGERPTFGPGYIIPAPFDPR
jgi:malate dehydrogenase (oxaloacetate-decarboxylating)(NADP+)